MKRSELARMTELEHKMAQGFELGPKEQNEYDVLIIKWNLERTEREGRA